MRITASRTRTAVNSHASSTVLSTRVLKQSTCTISNAEIATNVVNQDVQLESLISQFRRSGRAIRLLTRFR
jgi:ABC-type uncharacterized transport system involved in gliding motility auxiliary subunit